MPTWNVNFNTRVDTNHPEVVSCVAKAHALASVICDIPIPPHVKDDIDALNILRAVRGTTGIEGAELTEDEVREIMEATPKKQVLPKNRQRAEKEARNAQSLMRFVVQRLSNKIDAPLTENLVCEIHEITTKDINYTNNEPGKYRAYAVSAGDYVPPKTGEEVRRLMKGFIYWFNNDLPKSWDPIIRAIVAHFYIVSIHPFGEGNGRTSRGVESFLLYQAGINARGFYSLANFYYRNRDEYIRLLDYARFETNGDLTPFVFFALKGLVEELEEVHRQVLSEVKLISFRDYTAEVLTIHDMLATKAGDRMFHFLTALRRDTISIKDLRSGKHELSFLYRNLSSKTLSRDLDFLKKRELIIIEGDELRANLDIMTRYTPPLELEPPFSEHRVKSQKRIRK